MNQTEASDELRILRQQRMAAIRACEFKQARHIDHQMTLIKQNMAKTQVDDRRRSAEALYEQEKEAIKLAAANKYSEATAQIFEAKTAFQRGIQQIEQAQREALEWLEESHAKALELSQIRIVPEALVLKQKAQTSAVIRDYDAADTYFIESELTDKDTKDVRRDEVSERYAARKEALLAQFEVDRKTCRESYKKKIQEILRKHRLAGKRLDLRLGMRAHTLKLPINERFDLDDLEFTEEDDLVTDKRPQSMGAMRTVASAPTSPGSIGSPKSPSKPGSRQSNMGGTFSPRPERSPSRFIPDVDN